MTIRVLVLSVAFLAGCAITDDEVAQAAFAQLGAWKSIADSEPWSVEYDESKTMVNAYIDSRTTMLTVAATSWFSKADLAIPPELAEKVNRDFESPKAMAIPYTLIIQLIEQGLGALSDHRRDQAAILTAKLQALKWTAKEKP